MRNSERSRPSAARSRIHWFLCAGVAFVCWTGTARAGSTVLQFAQTNPLDIVTATESGGVTMLSSAGNSDGGGVSIPVTISNFLGTPGLSIPAFETFVGVTSTGAAATLFGQAFQGFTGTIEVTSGVGGTGSNFLTATFTDKSNPGVLGGTVGGAQAQLTATAPPQTLVLTSDFAVFIAPTSMTMGFSNVTPSFGVTSGSISSFTAQNTGTFGAAQIVPEPATFGMACMGLVFVALAVRNSQRLCKTVAKD